MLFWLFMTAMELVIPLTMLFFGLRFSKKAPKDINRMYGYRTSRSMENQETWNFAHKKLGRLWTKVGGIMLPVSVAAMLPVLGKDIDTVGMWGGVLMTVQCVPLVLTVLPVEKALKKTFDGRK